jgi:hypothetical protein
MASQVRNGKAFEWAVGIELVNNFGFKLHDDEIAKHNKACFDDSGISDKQRNNYQQSAKHAVEHIVEKENLEEDSGIISFLPDKKGKEGDVRDIVIATKNKEIGISCKTNHEAFKHSRLSKDNDFVKRWGLHPDGCSQHYFDTIAPIFNELKKIRTESKQTAKWAELGDVPARFYWPILNAFTEEVQRIESPEMCSNFIRYIVGKYDFYKVISTNNKVIIQAFNLSETLNTTKQPLPTNIDFIKDKNHTQYSKTIGFNQGWVFNFRIHNASSRVEASLKFDVNALALSYKHYTHHIDY